VQLLLGALADAQSVLRDLQGSLSTQSQEVAVLAKQQREVRDMPNILTNCVFVRSKHQYIFDTLYLQLTEFRMKLRRLKGAWKLLGILLNQ
jgi:hypothetical protein